MSHTSPTEKRSRYTPVFAVLIYAFILCTTVLVAGMTIPWDIGTYITHCHAVVWCLLALPVIAKGRQFKDIGRGVGALLVAGLVIGFTLLRSVFGVQPLPEDVDFLDLRPFAAALIVISLGILAELLVRRSFWPGFRALGR
ncbi:hypothetical protein ACUB14_001634 [Pseudomonas aeruginosa]|jgi:hypothetical protein|uniref:hypothetical protein n=1 Tax=Pseudomonas TaxID=286 RepID=UPI0005B2EEB6|nr:MULTISPECIES: hypothetical protein [Pseudomonas]EIW4148506.1 hypothetical protein [Pseudomonas aeruginosa]EJD6675197.1 hypothetical protein [Pseudomonas aeruginosa]EKB9387737.1 hypothetical protein [Pseudomonas aeruginosa]EKD1543888.1 hypothetical protein [Pseudomonas aeruginosa]EKU4830280.1 hypothetical protein [Pseudomonas aeruginosa]